MLALSSSAAVIIGGTCASDVMSLQCWHRVAEVGLLPMSDAVQHRGIAQAVAVVGDLSVRGGGLWRSDAAGALLNVGQEKQHSVVSLFLILSPSFPFLIPPYSLFLLYSSVIFHCLSPTPPPHSPLSVSVSLKLCCSPPLLHLVDLPGCMVRWIVQFWDFHCICMRWPCPSQR